MTNPTKERIAELREHLNLVRGQFTYIDQDDCIKVEEVIALLDTIETLQKERDDMKDHMVNCCYGCDNEYYHTT